MEPLNITPQIYNLRQEYAKEVLDEKKVNPNPFLQFNYWFDEAINANLPEPHAMHLSTSDVNGRVSGRIVLLREVNELGFVFYTNYTSRKAKEIAMTGFGSLTFFWQELERQVRIEGKIEKVAGKVSDDYFDSRPEGSKLGAWASNQSEKIESRAFLENKILNLEKEFEGKPIKRPDFWGGYCLVPDYFEFWQGRVSRLHDRVSFEKEKNQWVISRLSP